MYFVVMFSQHRRYFYGWKLRRCISTAAVDSLSRSWKIPRESVVLLSAPSERSVHQFIETRAIFLAARDIFRGKSSGLSSMESYFKNFKRIKKDPGWFSQTLENHNNPLESFLHLEEALGREGSQKSLSCFHVNKRAEYFYLFLKVGQEEVSQSIAEKSFEKYSTPGLLFKRFLEGTFDGKSHPDVINFCLERELASYSRLYDLDYHEIPVKEQFDSNEFPTWMCLGNINELKYKFTEYSELIRRYEAAFLWKIGKYSEALSIIGENAEKLLSSLDNEINKDNLTRLGVPLILNLQIIIKDLSKNVDTMTPAIEYYRLISNDLHQKYGIPLLQYLQNTTNLPDSLKYLEQSAFNAIFSSDSVNTLKSIRDTEFISTDFLYYFIKAALLRRPKERSSAMITSAKDILQKEDSEQTVKLMKNAMKDLLDIQVLEHLQSGEHENAVLTVTSNEFREQSLPSNDVCLLLIDAIKAEPELLKTLRDFLPARYPLRDKIVEIETNRILSDIRTTWNIPGQKIPGIKDLLIYYKCFIDFNHNLMFDEKVYDDMLEKILKYLRLFLSSLLAGGNSLGVDEKHDAITIFEMIRSQGQEIRDTRDDSKLLVCYWEELFLSGTPTFEKVGKEFLFENPWISQLLNVNRLIKRVNKLENVELMSKLVDICQTYDLKEYEKAVIAEELLTDKCKNAFLAGGLLSLFKNRFKP